MLVEHVEQLGRKALEEGGKIDKREIDGLISLIKGMDTIADITRTEEAATKRQIRRDEELREILTQINTRIIELAKELAAEMGQSDSRPAGG